MYLSVTFFRNLCFPSFQSKYSLREENKMVQLEMEINGHDVLIVLLFLLLMPQLYAPGHLVEGLAVVQLQFRSFAEEILELGH